MNHVSISDIHPDNWHLLEKDNKEYSPEKNYQVIRDVLAENDKLHYKLHPKVVKNAGDRADILASFAKYKLNVGGEKKLEQWLGKSWMSKIYGEKLIEKLRISEMLKNNNIQNGNTMYGGNFYLT